MNKKLKYTIIVLVVAFVIYIAYRFFKKPAEVKDTVKQPIQTESGNQKAIVENQQQRGPILVDLKSGGANVSNLANGLAPDPVLPIVTPGVNIPTTPTTPTTSTGAAPAIKIDLGLGPIIQHPTTGQPSVSDLGNGLAADVPQKIQP